MTRETGDHEAALRVLEELESRVAQWVPEWTARGPEDPARALLETFALSIADVREQLEGLPARVLPRLLAELGEEARWPRAGRSALIFVPQQDLDRAVKIRAGTGVTAATAHHPAGSPPQNGHGRSRPSFETRSDAWLSPARLRKALSVDDDRTVDLLIDAASRDRRSTEFWDGVAVFGRTVLDHHILLGDSAWSLLERSADEVVLEWPGTPAFVVDGRWEYSVHGGWRLLPLDFEVTVDGKGNRVTRMRILGPLPDIAPCEIHATELPWLRLPLGGRKRTQWALPSLAWVPGRAGAVPGREDAEKSAPKGAPDDALPRPIARIFSAGGERWEDHSFSRAKRVTAARPEAGSFPAVYLGFDRPLPASLYWSAGGTPPPGGLKAPRLAWEHSTGKGFQPFEPRDDTEAFSRAGTISWGLLDDWVAEEIHAERLFWVRARWVEGAYYDLPRLRGLYPCAVEVVEGRTVVGPIVHLTLAEGSRTVPFAVPGEGDWERFRVLEVETPEGDWRPLEHAAPGREPQVDQFSLRRYPVGPDGPVVPDGPGGRVDLTFGFDVAGAIRVRIPEVRVGLGAQLDPGAALEVLEAEVAGLVEVRQAVPSEAGRHAERLEEMCRRVRAEWGTGFRAVTVADFRRLVVAVDPEVARVEVVSPTERPAELCVVVFPEPPCRPGRIGVTRLEFLRQYLQGRVPLGTVVRVVEPCYVPHELELYCDRWKGLESEATELEEELRSYLDPFTGGAEGNGYPLGRALRLNDVEPIIERFLARAGTGTSKPSVKAVRVHSGLGRGWEQVSPFPLVYPILERLRLRAGEVLS